MRFFNLLCLKQRPAFGIGWHTLSQSSDQFCKKSVRWQGVILPLYGYFLIKRLQFLKRNKGIVTAHVCNWLVRPSRITFGNFFNKLIKHLNRLDKYSINGVNSILNLPIMIMLFIQKVSYLLIECFDWKNSLVYFAFKVISTTFVR